MYGRRTPSARLLLQLLNLHFADRRSLVILVAVGVLHNRMCFSGFIDFLFSFRFDPESGAFISLGGTDPQRRRNPFILPPLADLVRNARGWKMRKLCATVCLTECSIVPLHVREIYARMMESAENVQRTIQTEWKIDI